MLVQATLRSGRRIAKTKDCTTRGDRDDEVEVGGEEERREKKVEVGKEQEDRCGREGGQAVSLVAVTPCV
jgi:hypothetical protein